jgi:hypothetical protein
MLNQHTLSWTHSFAVFVRFTVMRLVAAFEATRHDRHVSPRVNVENWNVREDHAGLLRHLAEQSVVHGHFMHAHSKVILGHRHSLIGVKVDDKEAGTSRVDFLLECGVDRDMLRRLCLVAKDAHVSLCVMRVGSWLTPYLLTGFADFEVARQHLDAILNSGHRARILAPDAFQTMKETLGYDHAFIEVCTAQGLRLGVMASNSHMLTHLF